MIKGCFKAIVILVVLGLAAGMAALFYLRLGDRRDGLEYTVQFEDGRGLAPGADVRLDARQIGEVVAVRLQEPGSEAIEADLRIWTEQAGRVHAAGNSSARVHAANGVEPAWVEIVNRGEGGSGMKPGSVVQGLEDWAAETVWKGRTAATDAWKTAIQAVGDQVDELEEWAASEQGRRLRTQVEDYVDSLGEVASSASDDAQRQAAVAAQKGRALFEKLWNEDAPEAAAAVEESLKRLRAEGEELGEKAKEELDSALGEIRQLREKPKPAPKAEKPDDAAPAAP